MYKRSGALLLATLYAVTAMGFALNFHYCFNRLVSVKIYAQAKSCTAHEGKMKCCANKHLEVKVKDAHEGESPLLFAKMFASQLPRIAFVGDASLSQQYLSLLKSGEWDPPGATINSPDIVLKNCVFRI